MVSATLPEVFKQRWGCCPRDLLQTVFLHRMQSDSGVTLLYIRGDETNPKAEEEEVGLPQAQDLQAPSVHLLTWSSESPPEGLAHVEK